MNRLHQPRKLTGFADPRKGTNQTGMRDLNERLVLTLIRQHAALAKSELARMTGLSAQTVSVIIRALERDGLLLKGEPQRGKVGQPLVPMRLNPEGAFFFGLRIGRRAVDVVMTDFLGTIIARRRQRHDYPDFSAVLKFAGASVEEMTLGVPVGLRDQRAGMGIAMPFRMWDWGGLLGVDPALIQDWAVRDMRQELENHTGLPVFLQNDATSACGAELVFGTGDTPPDFLHFFVAFFIGGGLVLNGGLFGGTGGNAAALGSMQILDQQGQPVQLIDVASLMVLERALLARGADASMIWDDPEEWGFPADVLTDWAEQAAAGLAQVIQASVAVTDVRMVKIDGHMPASLRKMLVERVQDHVDAANFAGLERPEVQEGTVGPDARAIGAASQPLLARFMTGFAV